MTAETEVRTGVSQVSKPEIEDNCGLDMSPYQDLPRVGADCNGINHVHEDEQDVNANGNGMDDPDNSYVFVSGTDDASVDRAHKDLNADRAEESSAVPESSKVGSLDKGVEVQVEELNVENGIIVQSPGDENNCIVEGTDVVPSNNDVAPEGSLGKPDGDGVKVSRTDIVEEQNGPPAVEPEPLPSNNDVAPEGSLVKPDEDGVKVSRTDTMEEQNGTPAVEPEPLPSNNDVAPECLLGKLDGDGVKVPRITVEEQNGTPAVEPEPQQHAGDSKVSDRNELDSAPDSEENQESHMTVWESDAELGKNQESKIVSFEAADSDNVKVISEEQNTLDSMAELGESQEFQNVVLEAAECKSPEFEVREVKCEEQNGTPAVEPEPQQHDDDAKVSDRIELDSGPDSEENQESQIIVWESDAELGKNQESKIVSFEAADSDDVKVISEEQNTLGSNAELGESQEFQNVVLEAAECKSPEFEVREVKCEEQTKLEPTREGEDSLESEIIIAKSGESVSYQPDDGKEKLEEESKTDLDIDTKENQECQIVVTDKVQGGLDQGHEASKSANETDAPLEAKTASDPVSDESKDGLPTSHVKDCVSQTEKLNYCTDGSQKAPELDGSYKNAESLPSPADCMRSEIKIGTVPVESGESFSAGSDDGTVEQEVGYGPSLVTENIPIRAADDTKPEVEFSDVKHRENVISCLVDHAKLEIEVENGPVGGDNMESCPANNVNSGNEIGLGSTDPEEKVSTLQCDDVHIESELSKGDTECALSQSEYRVHDSLQNTSSAELESEVENSSAISSIDMPSNNGAVSGSDVLGVSVVNSESALNSVPEIVDVENVGDESNGRDGGSDNKLKCQGNEIIEAIHTDGISTSLPEGSSANAKDGQNVGAEVVTRPFQFLIRIPRFDDEKLREQIRHAQLQVDEKTQRRDAIRVEIQKKRAYCQSHGDSYETAKSEVRAARRLLKLKRQDIDSVQSVMNRVKNAISVEDIDGRIYNMEHMIEHETLPLKEEKQFIRDIKQLKHLREQLSSNMGSQDEVQQALDQRDQIEERLKDLKKELDCLKDRVLKAEASAVTASKRCDDESGMMKELQAQFRAADVIRQEAYTHLLSLKRSLFEKSKHFRMYKDDATAANEYALSGDREALYRLCVNQVETIMELWNKNDEFRKEYVRCNTRSTLRRLRTLDGRSLGPDEEPPVLPSYVVERVDRLVSNPCKANSVSLISTLEQEKQVSPVEGEAEAGKSMVMVAEQKNQPAKTKIPAKPIFENGSATVSGRAENEDTKEEEHMQTKEEQELARQAEESRKEEAAAKLKEQHRLEEMAKAKEALERKKRNAEKAQIRADLRAQKEAEQKEKEREKKLRKKERKKAAAAEAPDANNDGETALTLETVTEIIKEPEIKESPAMMNRKPQKPSQFTKQSKTKSIPPPLRNRGKRRMQQWMWVILTALIVLALFLLGNSSFSPNLGLLRSFGF